MNYLAIIFIIAVLLVLFLVIYFFVKGKKIREIFNKKENYAPVNDKNIIKENNLPSPKSYNNFRLQYVVDNQKVFEIQPVWNKDKVKFDGELIALENNQGLKNFFDAVFQQVPMLGVNIANLNYVVVTSPSEVAKGLHSGIYKFMQTQSGTLKAIAVDAASEKIVSIAEIATKINPVVAIGLTWQVAAMITAQKFLLDINERLEKIESSINELKEFMEIQMISSIIGDMEYLRKISNIIQNQLLSENEIKTFYSQLQDIERDCLKTLSSVKIIVNNMIKDIKEFDFKVSGTTLFDNKLEKSYAYLSQKIETIYRYLNFYLIVLYVRIMNIKLLAFLPFNDGFYKIITEDINREFEEIFHIRRNFFDFLSNKINLLDAKFSREKTKRLYKERLQEQLLWINKELIKREEYFVELKTQIGNNLSISELAISDEKIFIELDEEKKVKKIIKIDLDE